MKVSRTLSIILLVVAIGAGTIADRPVNAPPLTLGGYRVIAADFHTHSSTWSDGALTPWGMVLEARRQGLDAIAITGHNQVSDAKVARWFSRLTGGPTVLIGEEIITPEHHVIAVGIDHIVEWRQSVEAQAEDVHRQGGVAIAAHPFDEFWPYYTEADLRALDGTEICHPGIYGRASRQPELEMFAGSARAAAGGRPLTAIGSSDFHGFGRIGLCRTYVFARDDSAPAILDALRARRTVVYGLHGKAYGDPALVQLAAGHPELRDAAAADAPAGALDWISRVCGIAGLLLLIVAVRRP